MMRRVLLYPLRILRWTINDLVAVLNGIDGDDPLVVLSAMLLATVIMVLIALAWAVLWFAEL